MAVHIKSSSEYVTTPSFSPINLRRRRSFLLLLLITVINTAGVVEGTKKRVHITDDLHDVEDNEEDEEWIKWGEKKKKMTIEEFDPPPENFSELGIEKMQEEVMKRQVGQSYGFVKLRLDDRRTPNMVSDIAVKWTQLSRTGSIGVVFMGFDINTVMFTLQNAQNTLEFKDFVLSQPEAYEIKMGDRFFRRPGDLPYDELLKDLYKKTKKRGKSSNETTMKPELEPPVKPELEATMKTEL